MDKQLETDIFDGIEIGLYGLSILLFFISTQNYAGEIYNKNEKNETNIVDTGFIFMEKYFNIDIKDCKKIKIFTDYFMILLIGLFVWYCFAKNEYDFLYKSAFLVSILLILKRIMGLLTILPDPIKNECENDKKHNIGRCNELFFSGHFVVLTFLLLFTYFRIRRLFYPYALLFIGYMIMNLACQNHYTIDILTSIVLSGLVFYYNLYKN
jgi:hypothetical protein